MNFIQKRKRVRTINNFYITTAIDYPNGDPHLGHAYEKICADVIARYQRLLGKKVFYLTGTDEHGKKIKNKADEAGKSPKDYVDEMVVKFEKLCKVLDLSNDKFIRTTDEGHEKYVQDLLQKVYDKGDIYQGEYEGLYCTGCETYYTERDADEGKCPVHKKDLEELKEESYFFRMGKYKDALIDHINNNPNFIRPESRRNEILNRLKGDLNDLSISRTTFDWGIPLPFNKKHYTYVWYDALTNYLSGLTYPYDTFDDFWPADVHMIGKDIVWHHTVIWPTMLMSAGIELPKTIFAHGFVNLKGEKLSKSSGLSIDPFDLVKMYGSDSLRYYLMRNVPFGHDGDFSEETLIERINNELADNFGNFVHRTLTYTKSNFKRIPARGELTDEDNSFLEKLTPLYEEATKEMNNLRLTQALNKIMQFSGECNAYLNQQEPWKIEDKGRVETIMNICCNRAAELSILLHPFVPEACEKIWSWMELESPSWDRIGDIATNDIGDVKPLFRKFEKEEPEKRVQEPELFSKLNLKVAEIKSVEKHPDADKLYVIKIDCGEERQIVSGLVDYYEPKDLVGKKVVLLSNLKKAKIRGVESQGMLLAGEDEGNVGVILSRGEPGEQVFIEGIDPSSEEIDINLFSKVKMKVDGGNVYYKNKRLQTKESPVICEIESGKVR